MVSMAVARGFDCATASENFFVALVSRFVRYQEVIECSSPLETDLCRVFGARLLSRSA